MLKNMTTLFLKLILILTFMLCLVNCISSMELLMGVMLIEIALIIISITKIWHHVMMLIILLEFLSLALLKSLSFNSFASLNMASIYLMMVMMVSEASLGMALITMVARSSSLNSAII